MPCSFAQIVNKVAIIPLTHEILPGGNIFNTLHGYWKPPNYVLSYWATGAVVRYIDEETYQRQVIEVQDSHKECLERFYRENAL